jgi:RNA polymerase sigma-70 factor (ECF subfamily)
MDDDRGETTVIGELLDRLRAGDASAREGLLQAACARLGRLARRMLRDFPGVARWEGTDDVLQNATLRLYRALKDATPESPRSFFNLAAVLVRRELIDLARHHYGPHGMGANHESVGPTRDGSRPGYEGQTPETDDPGRLIDWAEFHGQVEALPDEQREVFNLVWYQGLTQADAAALLGVTERVVKWRWRAARLSLHKVMKGELPG